MLVRRLEDEVVQESPIVPHGQRPDPTRTLHHERGLHCGDILLEELDLRLGNQRLVKLLECKAQVLAQQRLHPAEAQELAQIPQVDVRVVVSLSGKRQHRVGANVDVAINLLGEVNPEEGKPRVRNLCNGTKKISKEFCLLLKK